MNPFLGVMGQTVARETVNPLKLKLNLMQGKMEKEIRYIFTSMDMFLNFNQFC